LLATVNHHNGTVGCSVSAFGPNTVFSPWKNVLNLNRFRRLQIVLVFIESKFHQGDAQLSPLREPDS